MDIAKVTLTTTLLLQILLSSPFLLFDNLAVAAACGLKYGFYEKTCPNAEDIVHHTVAMYLADDPTVAAPLLRLHFHDCFVRGCDGSVLLNSTKSSKAEKDADPDLTLDGFYVIDAAKAALEKECPAIVSCADIVAIAARDSVHLSKGLRYEVQTGRRDGRVSFKSDVEGNIPLPNLDFAGLKSIFTSKGLTVKDLVLLSGAHTIGQSHCFNFVIRIYDFIGKDGVGPKLNHSYMKKLRRLCKPKDNTTTVNMDPRSPTKFNNQYYKLVRKNKGLFQSDAALLQDQEAASYVHLFSSSESHFLAEFGASMVRMGSIGVLTGKAAGEIRKNCALVN